MKTVVKASRIPVFQESWNVFSRDYDEMTFTETDFHQHAVVFVIWYSKSVVQTKRRQFIMSGAHDYGLLLMLYAAKYFRIFGVF